MNILKWLEIKGEDDWTRLTFYPLKLLWCGGLHPYYRSWQVVLNAYFNFFYFFSLTTLAMIMLVISIKKHDVLNAIESILTIFLISHIMGKYVVLHFHKTSLVNLLEQRNKFWGIDDCSSDVIKRECRQDLKNANRFIKWFLGYCGIVIVNYLGQPFTMGRLPVVLYIPEGWFNFLLCSILYLTPFIVSTIWGTDTIFYTLSTPVSIQFKLLGHKFENLRPGNFKKEIQVLLDHHNFLIWYSNELNRIFSPIFFLEYLVAIVVACIQLFIATQSQFDFLNKSKCLSYFIMQIMEIGIFCFNTDSIAENANNVGNAAYRSIWYQFPMDYMKKDIELVINRSQKTLRFDGLGLIWINVETFTRIFQTALSFNTYLNTVVY